MKQCTLCKQIKPLDDFYDDKRISVYDAKRGKKMRKNSSSGKQARCKACHMKVAHATRDKKKQAAATQRYQERNRGLWKTLPAGTTKKCTGYQGECKHEEGPELPANDKYFSEKAKCKYGLNPRCRICHAAENKGYHARKKAARGD